MDAVWLPMGLRLPLLLIQRRVQVGHASVRNADAGQYLANEGSAADVRARPWSGLHGHTEVSQLMATSPAIAATLSISLSRTRSACEAIRRSRDCSVVCVEKDHARDRGFFSASLGDP